jgi:hypothetical protein
MFPIKGARFAAGQRGFAMLLTLGIIAVALGLACIFERDLVWMLYEYDHRLTGTLATRTPRWEHTITYLGYFLVYLGIVAFWGGLRF